MKLMALVAVSIVRRIIFPKHTAAISYREGLLIRDFSGLTVAELLQSNG